MSTQDPARLAHVESGTEMQRTAVNMPLVSVIILSYNRRETLAATLDSVLCQDYPNFEVIVADNHSEEDIRELIEAKSAAIRLVELPQNLGSCAGRNAGIRAARGEFLVTIDNDVHLASPFELSKIVRTFRDRPEADVLIFQICDADTGKIRLREWCHPRYWKDFSQTEFETSFLAEGASAFRRHVFENVGLYFEPFFIGHEGGDLAFRILDRGYRMWYAPQVRILHLASPLTRSSERTYRLYTRNYIWMTYRNLSGFFALRFLLPKLAMMFYFALRANAVGPFFSGLWQGVAGLRGLRDGRHPVSRATKKYLNNLDKGRPSWRVRLARHRVQPQI